MLQRLETEECLHISKPRDRGARSLLALIGTVMTLWAMTLWAGSAVAEPLAGTVLDGQTLTPIPDARVTLLSTPPDSPPDPVAQEDQEPPPAAPQAPAETGALRSVLSDGRGVYEFDNVPVGRVELRVEAAGYEPTTEILRLPPGGRLDVALILFPPGAAAEVIEVEARAPPRPTPPGKTDLRREELTRIPGTRGDALTSIKSLPGVANADAIGAGPGLLVIRGAAPEDSKVSIDGIEVPLLYHFFGLQSVVPSEFISAIDFLPGGFGADEGRATGGIINITTRDESAQAMEGFAEVSFINFAGLLRGPISRERNLYFSAGVRRSFIDFILPAVIPEDANIQFTTAPQYYDGQLRVDWQPDYRNRVTLLGLGSFDLLTLLNDTVNPNEPLLVGTWENETSFTRAILSWRHTSDSLENRLVASAGTTGFRFEIGEDRFLRFDQRTVEVREDLSWKAAPRVTLRAGGDAAFRSTDSEVLFPAPPQEGSGGPTNFSTAPLLRVMETVDNHVAAGYVAADVRPVRGTTITPGLRLDHYDRYGETTLSPRVSVEQQIGDDWKLRLALGSYSRPPLQNESFQTDIRPELATQYVLGADYDIASGIKLQASGFYTDRRQLIVQDAILAATDPIRSYVNRGFGRSFGSEFLVRAKRDRFFGWIAYTLSRSDRVDGPQESRRLFDYDQTHNLIMVASYRLGGWEFGGRWQYSTGNPITPVVDSLFLADTNVYIPIYGAINSDRLNPAHQLDLRVDRKWQYKTWSLALYLDVTNVYANPRTLGFQYNFDFSERQAIKELPLVPALGMRGSF